MTATRAPAIQPLNTTPQLPGDAPAEACVNCGRVLQGPYCIGCGERRASDRNNSFWGFVKEAVQAVTNADRSFLASLKVLLNRPGELTMEYMRGRRVGLMAPLQLFLVVNVAYFLVVTVTGNQMLTTTLYNHMNNAWHSGAATRMVDELLQKETVSLFVYEDRLEAYRKRFDAVTAVQAKTLIFTMVPAFAVLAGLIHVRRRRYVVEHLVFSLHVYSAFLILSWVALLPLAIPMFLVDWIMGTRASASPMVDGLIGVVMLGVLGWYLRRAVSRVYGDGPLFSVIAAALLVAGIALIMFGYRTLLFLTTYWAVNNSPK